MARKNTAKTDPTNVSNVVIAEGRKWRKVHKPRAWRPSREGEIITGLFGGRQSKDGKFGPYEVLMLQTDDGIFYLSGSVLLTLLDGAGQMTPETRLRVVFLGRKPMVTDEGEYKDFDLFVER